MLSLGPPLPILDMENEQGGKSSKAAVLTTASMGSAAAGYLARDLNSATAGERDSTTTREYSPSLLMLQGNTLLPFTTREHPPSLLLLHGNTLPPF